MGGLDGMIYMVVVNTVDMEYNWEGNRMYITTILT